MRVPGLAGRAAGAPRVGGVAATGEEQHRHLAALPACISAALLCRGVYPWHGCGAGRAEVTVRHFDIRVRSGLAVLVTGNAALEDSKVFGMDGDEPRGVCALAAATADIRRCRFHGLTRRAIAAQDDACVSLRDSTVAGSCRHGFVMHDQARLTAQYCGIFHGQAAVHISPQAAVCSMRLMSHCKRTTQTCSCRLRHAAAQVAQAGGCRTAVKLVDSVLTGAAMGAWASDAAADVTIVRCSVAAAQAGVSVTGPVDARIEGGSITSRQTGVEVGVVGEPCQAAREAFGWAGEQAVQAAAAAAVSGFRGGATAAAKCTREGAVARSAMADYEVSRCSLVGVNVGVLGCLTASRVTAHGCSRGFSVGSNGTAASLTAAERSLAILVCKQLAGICLAMPLTCARLPTVWHHSQGWRCYQNEGTGRVGQNCGSESIGCSLGPDMPYK